MSGRIDLDEGRALFGRDAGAYDDARPDYPDWVYARLQDEGALFAGARVVEIGAGNGLATRRLLTEGASLVAIEPDPRFGAMLATLASASAGACRVVCATFEAADLEHGAFDLVAAATAFHWIDPNAAVPKAAAVLRHGGFVAIWSNVFQDLDKDDPFHDATQPLLAHLAASPSAGGGALPYALDTDARLAMLEKDGLFADARHFESKWTLELNARDVRKLYAGFSNIARLDERTRQATLDGLAAIAANEFGDRVERNMTTVLYLARRT